LLPTYGVVIEVALDGAVGHLERGALVGHDAGDEQLVVFVDEGERDGALAELQLAALQEHAAAHLLQDGEDVDELVEGVDVVVRLGDLGLDGVHDGVDVHAAHVLLVTTQNTNTLVA